MNIKEQNKRIIDRVTECRDFMIDAIDISYRAFTQTMDSIDVLLQDIEYQQRAGEKLDYIMRRIIEKRERDKNYRQKIEENKAPAQEITKKVDNRQRINSNQYKNDFNVPEKAIPQQRSDNQRKKEIIPKKIDIPPKIGISQYEKDAVITKKSISQKNSAIPPEKKIILPEKENKQKSEPIKHTKEIILPVNENNQSLEPTNHTKDVIWPEEEIPLPKKAVSVPKDISIKAAEPIVEYTEEERERMEKLKNFLNGDFYVSPYIQNYEVPDTFSPDDFYYKVKDMLDV